MNSKVLVLVTTLTLTGAVLPAQSTIQQFELHGTSTSFTSRSGVGTGAGTIFQGVHSTHHHAVMETGSDSNNPPISAIAEMGVVHQDQNCATPEQFDFVIRGGTNTDGPGVSTGDILGEILGLNLPPGTANGACSWTQTASLSASARIAVPRDGFWAMGVRFSPSPNWVFDGHSVHTAFGSSGFPNQSSWVEDSTGTNLPDHAWELLPAATVATHPTNNRTWRIAAGFEGVALQLGSGLSPGSGSIGFGMGGLFPKVGAGFFARLRGGSNLAGAVSLVAASTGFNPNGIVFGSGARLYLDGTIECLYGPLADTDGEVILPYVASLPSLGLPPGTRIPFQGMLHDPNLGTFLTNVQFTEPQ